MFGRAKRRRQANDAKLEEMHERLDRNSKLIEEDHDLLIELKTQFEGIVEENEALRLRIEALEGAVS